MLQECVQVYTHLLQFGRKKIEKELIDKRGYSKPMITLLFRMIEVNMQKRASAVEVKRMAEELLKEIEKNRISEGISHKNDKEITTTTTTTKEELRETLRMNYKPVAFANMWSKELDNATSIQNRKNMIQILRSSKKLRNVSCEQVLEAMEVVPRHIFACSTTYKKESERIKIGYDMKPFRACSSSVSSSPVVILAMLSLCKIRRRSKICVFGIKGGYIQSVISQMLGIDGKVIVYSTDQKSFKTIQDRCQIHCPLYLNQKWILGKSLTEFPKELKERGHFDSMIITGKIPKRNLPFYFEMLAEGGYILAPVGEGKSQRLTVVEKIRGKCVQRVVKDWNVVFGDLM